MSKRVFILLLCAIALFGAMLRFWNYTERFGLAYDQAHDVLVARYALASSQLPLLGPFSSAGPFQTSGVWYWIIMFGSVLSRSSVISPWVVLTLLYVGVIVGMGLLAEKLEDWRLGLIAALLTSISTAQVAQSVNLTNQTPIAVVSFLVMAFSVSYVKTPTLLYAFLTAFFVSLAASIHLQGVALGIVLVVTLIMGKKFTVKLFISVLAGLLLPTVPILLYDLGHQFINLQHMLQYFLVDQNKINMDVLGRRWLTYIAIFWPTEWAHIIGGSQLSTVVVWIVAAYVLVQSYLKKTLKSEWVALFFGLCGMIIVVRYTRTPIFSSFIVFTHPFILLLTSWILYLFMKLYKNLGTTLLLTLIILTLRADFREIKPTVNTTALYAREVRQKMQTLYPGESISVYDWNYETAGFSLPVVLYLDEQKFSSSKGRKIGISSQKNPMLPSYSAISKDFPAIVDLSASTSAQLTADKWIRVDPDAIYAATEYWND